VTHRPAVAGAVRRVLVYTAAPGLGGAEISLGHLLAHTSPAVDVIVAGTSPQVVTHLSGRRPGTPGVVLPASGPRAPAAQLAAFRRLRPQVVHVNRHVPWAAATAIAAALATPAARVVTVDQLPLRTVDLLELWRTRMLTLRADAAVAVGEASARRLEDFYALGRGSVRSIPNGVPDPGVRRRDRPAAAPLVVGAVGRLDPMKGHDVLLRALARVDGVRLTLVGSGAEEAALRRLALSLGIADRVTFAGWLASPAQYLPTVDVFALPSRSEGSPLALAEAMLAELPCVATSVGSVPEAITTEHDGLLVPKDDPGALAAALTRLRDDAALRTRLGAAARVSALARSTAATMTAAYEQVWAAVVARPRASRLHPPPPRP
jgi:glycosyltransferase involved in cell wall biosynthesis